MIVVITDPTVNGQDFLDAADGADVDWDKSLANFNAVVDWPTCTFYKQLINKYPDAKVIHTTRSPEAWYESAKRTIYKFSTADIPNIPENLAMVRALAKNLVWEGELQGKFENKEEAMRLFLEHDEDVKRTVPADRLLIFNTGEDGWDKLCSFLGKEVPNKPWPHVNQSENFDELSKALVERTVPEGSGVTLKA
jgi:hypothetical protein